MIQKYDISTFQGNLEFLGSPGQASHQNLTVFKQILPPGIYAQGCAVLLLLVGEDIIDDESLGVELSVV